MSTPEELVNNGVQIPSLPALFNEINEAVEDPESSFTEIARIISGDTALSGRLLRIVNSSFFGFPQQVETITHAVTIVGTAQLRDLVLATTIISRFQGLPRDLINMESFWKHNIACGLAARTIAVYRREPNAERFYVNGMLHDLGRLVLCLSMPEKVAEMFGRGANGELMRDAEMELLGFDHAEVGGELLKKWKLPKRVEDAVRYHHQPTTAREYPLEAAILHVADVIAHAMQLGCSGERHVPPLDAQAWDKIELPSNIMASVIDQVDRQFEETIHFFLSDS